MRVSEGVNTASRGFPIPRKCLGWFVDCVLDHSSRNINLTPFFVIFIVRVSEGRGGVNAAGGGFPGPRKYLGWFADCALDHSSPSNTESVNPCVFFSGGLRTEGVYFYQPCTIIQLPDVC